MPRPRLALTALALTACATAAQAADLHNDGVFILDDDPALSDLFVNDVAVIQGELCVGGACTSAETFASTTRLKITSTATSIDFIDTSTGSFPGRDWRLRVNDSGTLGIDRFSIEDLDIGTIPFTIEGPAPEAALYVSAFGNVGLGTAMPLENLHITDLFDPGLRLEVTGGSPYSWDIGANGAAFFVADEIEDTVPVVIRPGAPSFALHVDASGNVGLGAVEPDAPLELFGPDSFNFLRITADGAAVNPSVDVVFTEGPLGTGELRYNIVDGDGPELRLDANGDMVLDGTLNTGGPTCAGGCDAVFDADFPRLSVTDHAALMWENGHLPAVGPTLPGQPMNVSEKMGGILNELEHAHIYIEELNARLAAQEALNARLIARLDALEAAD